MGPPGSGKGTQAQHFVETRGWSHLSTGELFRTNLSQGTALGTLARSFMDKGSYVPDEVTIGMVRERLTQIPRATRIIFDGFPRTVPQTAALTSLLAESGRRLEAVVLMEVPREQLLSRLGARVTCAACQTVYSLAVRPPKVPGVCDRCGGVVAGTTRSDESPEIILRRLEVYEEQTAPVAAHYDSLGLVRRVDGSGMMSDVTARLAAAFA